MNVQLQTPSTIEEALRLKCENSDSMFLAGGQTLVAMMNTDLVEPTALISLGGVSTLKSIEKKPDGSIRIGAMVRHVEIESSDLFQKAHAVVGMAAKVIAHPAIRNLGTIGGAVSHGDPNADFPAALVAASASVEIMGPTGSREILAADFFLDYLTTDLHEDEILMAITLPPPPARSWGHYEKFARVDGDYATTSVALTLSLNDDGTVNDIPIVLGASGATPIRVPSAEQRLLGGKLDAASVTETAKDIAASCDPLDDVRGSSEYRILLIPRLIEKATMKVKAMAEI
jgi:carbon-monoxide dehydrogenase medium subunit